MAGLLGDFNYTDPGVGLAAGLLSGRGNLGANLAVGLLGGQQTAQANRQFGFVEQNAERANRANDLQQISGLYQTLQTQDMIQAIQDRRNGVAHIPNPALATLQQKMAELAGLPPLSGGSGLLGNSTPSAAPFQYGANPSLSAPSPAGQNPVGQNFLGANPNYQPLPLPTSQIGQPPTPIPNSQPPQSSQSPPQADPFADQRDEADMYALLARKPELMAENRYKLSTPMVSRGVSFNPATGMPMAGFVDNVPVQFQNGRPQVIQSDIPQAIAQRAGAVAGAQAAATSPYKTEMVTDAAGRTVPRFLTQLPGYPGGAPAPQPAIPPQVAAAAASGQPFEATQTPDGKVSVNTSPQNPQDMWATIPKVPQPTGLGQSTQDKKMVELRAEKIGKLSDQYSAEGDVANQRIALNDQALNAVDSADTGFFSGAVSTYRNILGSLGVKDAANKAATDQDLGKNLINTALNKGKQLFGSRFTQSEVGIMLSQASPSPQMQKLAIKFLLQSDNLTQQYNIQRGNDFGEYIAREGDPLRFTNWYNGARPLTKQLESLAQPGDASTSSVQGFKVLGKE